MDPVLTPYVVMLITVLIMPENVPDKERRRKVDTEEVCLSAAKQWLQLDAQELGGVGLMAGCLVTGTRHKS